MGIAEVILNWLRISVQSKYKLYNIRVWSNLVFPPSWPGGFHQMKDLLSSEFTQQVIYWSIVWFNADPLVTVAMLPYLQYADYENA